MARATDPIFLGVTKAPSRQFVTAALQHLQPTHPVVHLPAIGAFSHARAALIAGYEPGNIRTSDISLFSGLLGAVYDPEAAWPTFTLAERHQAAYEAHSRGKDRAQAAAFVLWLMKRIQTEKEHYLAAQLEDLDVNRDAHVDRLAHQLRGHAEQYAGIRYQQLDLRALVHDETLTDHEVVVVNPPIFAGGYSKMFDFGDEIAYESGVAEFQLKQEYHTLYDHSAGRAAPFLWFRPAEVRGFNPAEVVYSIEEKPQQTDFWLCTRPDELAGFPHRYGVHTFTRKKPTCGATRRSIYII